jgi:hypothetical protein
MSEQTNPEETTTELTELTEEQQLEQMIAEEEAQRGLTNAVVDDVQELDEKSAAMNEAADVVHGESEVESSEENSEEEVLPEPDEEPAPGDEEQPPTDVETAVVSAAFGWQQAPSRPYARPANCIHIGRVVAQKELPHQAVGDEWICTCGTSFDVVLNTAGKKVLKQRVS